MFVRLTIIELRHIFKNILFYVLILLTFLFTILQVDMDVSQYPKKPVPPDEMKQEGLGEFAPYGKKRVTDPQRIMEITYKQELSFAAQQGEILKNYLIINKSEKLNKKQVNAIKKAMSAIAPDGIKSGGSIDIAINYKEFLSLMDQLDSELGGKTPFASKKLEGTLTEPKTYEDAIKSYHILTDKDLYTRAVARYVADYLGLALGVLPFFLAAFIFLKDKKNKMEELIMSKQVLGYYYVGAKFTAICIALFVSVIVFALYYTIQAFRLHQNGYDVDLFAFIPTFMIWLFPTIMGSVAISMFTSLLFKSFIPSLFVQLFCWVVSIIPIEGDYRLYKLFIRHNSFEPIRADDFALFAINRIFITGVAILLIVITALIWEKRRTKIGEQID